MSDQGPRGVAPFAATVLATAANGAAASAWDSADGPAPKLPSGQRLGAFRIVAKLGEGGMGVVYLAEDERLHRRVALKVLVGTGDDEPRRRFLREARAAAAVAHPNIAAIHEVGEVDGVSFIAMELVRGRTLRDVLSEKIERREPFSLPEIIRIGLEVARGLTAAHRAGIVHRDLKPENVMISDDDRVILLDFGIAKRVGVDDPSAAPRGGDLAAPADVATTAGGILGTPGYMSPEQSSGSRVDSRTDVFALGVMLYELLTGERPFGGASLFAVLLATRRTIVGPPSQRRPDTPPELDRIVQRCLEKSPEARYRDGAELLSDLDRLAQPPPSAEVPLPPDSLMRRGLAFSAVHFPILLRIVGLGVSPLLALVLARHVLLRFLPASAANAAQLVCALILSVAVLFVLESTHAALTACTAWLLANPRRDVRVWEAFAALRGKLGAFAGAVLLSTAAVLVLMGGASVAVGALSGRALSTEVWRVLYTMSPGLTLVMTIAGSALMGPVTVRRCLVASVLALERRGTMAALRRSSEIVRRAQRPILRTWLAALVVLQLPAVVTTILAGSVVRRPIVSFEGLLEGDLTATIAMLAFCAAEAVLLLPFGVALAFGYLEARQAEGETLEGIVRAR